MKSALSRRQQTAILVFSLLLHLALLLAMFASQLQQADFYTKPNFDDREQLITIENINQEQSMPERDWVAINSAGAPLPSQSPDTHLETIEESQEQPHDAPSAVAIEKAIALAEQILKSDKSEPNEVSAQPEPVVDQKNIEPSPIQKPEITIETKDAKTPQLELKTAPPKKFTFAQLAQGFANHLETAAMAVQSNTQGTASVEQLKHIHYCQKIIGCLVTSYKINRDSAPHHKIMGAALIKLALHQDGSIATLALMQSSGNQAMDRFLLHIFQDASSSFPPVPASFKEKPYPLPIFNIEHLEAFQSVNGWYINNTK